MRPATYILVLVLSAMLCRAEEAFDFETGYAKVKPEGKWGIIDTAAHFIIVPKYNTINYLNPYFFVVKEKSGNRGVIHKNGKKAIDCSYKSIIDFDNINE